LRALRAARGNEDGGAARQHGRGRRDEYRRDPAGARHHASIMNDHGYTIMTEGLAVSVR
jgi:hypothetical protein